MKLVSLSKKHLMVSHFEIPTVHEISRSLLSDECSTPFRPNDTPKNLHQKTLDNKVYIKKVYTYFIRYFQNLIFFSFFQVFTNFIRYLTKRTNLHLKFSPPNASTPQILVFETFGSYQNTLFFKPYRTILLRPMALCGADGETLIKIEDPLA